ncbi:FeoA family protein [uncultured Dubosiella sp.]|uniref:FeoA family protein n=1 Tax=uncultured Dubosiella sp. TaxID=1937011 RepID=UPI00259337CE|nr:FeoA family protein [uncultured Dubosiella sp.]
MPLTYANVGTVYRVQKVGGRDRIRSHLQNLGFVENESVLVRQSAGGNLIVEVKGRCVAIDAGLGRRIFVQDERRTV